MTNDKKEIKFELERSPTFGIEGFLNLLYSAESSPAFIMTLGEKDKRETYFLPRFNMPRMTFGKRRIENIVLQDNTVLLDCEVYDYISKNYDLYKHISKELKGCFFQPKSFPLKKCNAKDYMVGDWGSLDKESFFKVFNMLWKEEVQKIHEGSNKDVEKAVETSLKIDELFPFSDYVYEILIYTRQPVSQRISFAYPINISHPSTIITNNDFKLHDNIEILPSSIKGQEIFMNLDYPGINPQTIRQTNKLDYFELFFYTKLPLTTKGYILESESSSKKTQPYYEYKVSQEIINTVSAYIAKEKRYLVEMDSDFMVIRSNCHFSDFPDNTINTTKELEHFYKVFKKSYDFIQKKLQEQFQKENNDLAALLKD